MPDNKNGLISEDRDASERPLRKKVLWLLSNLTRALMKISLRYQVLVPEVEKLLRWQAALLVINDPEFAVAGPENNQTTASHAAVATGLTRQTIAQLQTEQAPVSGEEGRHLHRLIRIVQAWSSEPEYQKDGKPVDLPLTGPAPSLHALNRRYGRSVPDRAIADWLVSNGNAEWREPPGEKATGNVLLWRHSVLRPVPFSSQDVMILGQHGYDFLHTLQESLDPKIDDQPRLRQIYFTDIPRERMEEAHTALKQVVQDAMAHYKRVLSEFREPDCTDPVRVGVGVYTFKGAELLEADDGSHTANQDAAHAV